MTRAACDRPTQGAFAVTLRQQYLGLVAKKAYLVHARYALQQNPDDRHQPDVGLRRQQSGVDLVLDRVGHIGGLHTVHTGGVGENARQDGAQAAQHALQPASVRLGARTVPVQMQQRELPDSVDLIVTLLARNLQ